MNIIYRDPVFDGAADPTVIRRESDGLYFMFYTQRRATLECAGVEWAHGTKIGVAVCEKAFGKGEGDNPSVSKGAALLDSSPCTGEPGRLIIAPTETGCAGGWRYVGTAELPFVEGKTTYWAPEVIFDGENYRMFVSSVDGVYADWSGSAEILQFVSPDLVKWSPVFSQTNYTERHPERSDAEHRAVEGSPGFSERSEREGDSSDVVLGMTDTSSAPSGHLLLEGKVYKSCAIPIDSPRVIDACAFPLPSGGWRLWYKDEKRGSHTYYIDTFDFREWRPGGEATSDTDQEGPNVFEFGGRYWLIADVWDGLAVYRSDDLTRFTRQEGNLLPGAASHADVFVEDGRAWLVYFTYPEGDRRSAVCVCELKAEGGRLCVSMSS